MAALQFFLLSLDDHKDAWERYLKLVRRAGLASYTELLQTAGLKVPFAEGSVKGIAQQMTRWLEEHRKSFRDCVRAFRVSFLAFPPGCGILMPASSPSKMERSTDL